MCWKTSPNPKTCRPTAFLLHVVCLSTMWTIKVAPLSIFRPTGSGVFINLKRGARVYHARRATAGPGKPLSRGPIITSCRMRRDRDAEGVERDETWRGARASGVSPHHPTRGLGERRKLPGGVRGGASAENGFYAYLRSERSHLEHHF